MLSQSHESRQLSSINASVWFLGYGLGGCTGLSFIAGLWSLLVDSSRSPAVIAIIIAILHGSLLVYLWSRRSVVSASMATRACFLSGAIGIAAVAWLLTESSSRVPAVASLYSLAILSLTMAAVMPLMHRNRP